MKAKGANYVRRIEEVLIRTLADFGVEGIAKRSSGQKDCSHPNTLGTITAGLVRVVCEECGYVGVGYFSGLQGQVHRTRFSRAADDEQVAPTPSDVRLVGIFASKET